MCFYFSSFQIAAVSLALRILHFFWDVHRQCRSQCRSSHWVQFFYFIVHFMEVCFMKFTPWQTWIIIAFPTTIVFTNLLIIWNFFYGYHCLGTNLEAGNLCCFLFVKLAIHNSELLPTRRIIIPQKSPNTSLIIKCEILSSSSILIHLDLVKVQFRLLHWTQLRNLIGYNCAVYNEQRWSLITNIISRSTLWWRVMGQVPLVAGSGFIVLWHGGITWTAYMHRTITYNLERFPCTTFINLTTSFNFAWRLSPVLFLGFYSKLVECAISHSVASNIRYTYDSSLDQGSFTGYVNWVGGWNTMSLRSLDNVVFLYHCCQIAVIKSVRSLCKYWCFFIKRWWILSINLRTDKFVMLLFRILWMFILRDVILK